MKRAVFDIETDGLLPELTTIHSLVLRDLDTGEVVSCADGRDGYHSIAHGLALLSAAERIYGHNAIKFDIPAILKVHPEWTYQGKLLDTLVTAAMRFAHIADRDYHKARNNLFPAKLAGSHSLKAWGIRLGVLKGDFGETTDWAEWTPEMQTYCEQDTEVTRQLVFHLRKAGLSTQAVEIEHELAWYLAAQERNGWPFDTERAISLYARLSARREELAAKLREHFGSWYAGNGETNPKRDMKRKGAQYLAGAPYTKLKDVEFNPASRQHIAKRLTDLYGWKPLVFTPSGQAEVSEETLKGLDFPIAAELVEYLTVDKRLGQLSEGKEAWLKQVTPEGRIHGRCIQNKAVTHRAAHANPNLAQVPAVGSPYGEECRELFTVPDGWVLLGSDASGLELRCLSHYMAPFDGGAYGRAVVEGRNEDGTDVHSVNRDALGLSGKQGRADAKTFIYAFLYGSGVYNLGCLIGVTPEEIEAFKAKRKLWERMVSYNTQQGYPLDDKGIAHSCKGSTLKAAFLKNTPALGNLIDAVKEKAKHQGYLMLPDGRPVYIRSVHAALNSLLQGAGAIICKLWIVLFSRRLTERFGPQGWDGKWAALGWIHDEVQIAVRPEIAEEAAQILIEEIERVTTLFKWRVPLTGEAKLGANWKETH